MNRFTAIAGLTLALFAAAGCIKREPGPAERIGRGLDEIAAGLADWERESTSEEERRRRSVEPRRQDRPYETNTLPEDRDRERSERW